MSISYLIRILTERENCFKETNMGEKIPKIWIYVLIVLVVLLGAVLAGKSILGKKGDVARLTLSLEDKTLELEKRNRQVQDLESQIAQLRQELKEHSKHEEELQARLDDVAKSLSSAQQKLKSSVRQAERPAPTQPQPRERTASRPVELPPPAGRRPAEPGSYEVIRTTSVYAEPAGSSRQLSMIQRGTRVTVVGSAGEWLEIRSRHGNPPGFIRRDDAMFVERKD
jgi:TolA-binding protein